MRVGIFITCLVDGIFPNVGVATVELLKRLNLEIDVPIQQTCCGQMHINTGYRAKVIPLLKNQVRSFKNCDFVVAPSASCVGTVRHQYETIAREVGDFELAADVKQLGERTFELSEFLTDVLDVTEVGAYFPHSVTYHPTCHSLRVLELEDRPLRLLRAVEGIEVIPLADSDSCCGFGGTFAVKNPDVSGEMLADKLLCIRRTGARFVTSLDSSCLMQIGGGLSRTNDPIRPLHLVEILASTR
jgi:L-lactate dehydrogenase complex protein LldE